MSNFKKIGLTLAVLPLFFVVSIIFSSVINNVQQAEAAACRAIVNFDGVEIGDKNKRQFINYPNWEGLIGAKFNVVIKWKTDLTTGCTGGACGTMDAEMRVPSSSKVEGFSATSLRSSVYNEGSKRIYPLRTSNNDIYLSQSFTISDLGNYEALELYSRAGGDKCTITTGTAGLEVLVNSINGPTTVYQGETHNYSTNLSWITPAEYRFGGGWSGNPISNLSYQNLSGNTGNTTITKSVHFPDDLSQWAGTRVLASISPTTNTAGGVYSHSKGMKITVLPKTGPDPQLPATLNVESYLNGNRTSGVTISQISGSPSGMGGATHYTRTKDSTKIDTVRLRAPATFSSTNDTPFSHWEDCISTSGNDCSISVDQDDEKTIRVYYAPDTKLTTLRVVSYADGSLKSGLRVNQNRAGSPRSGMDGVTGQNGEGVYEKDHDGFINSVQLMAPNLFTTDNSMEFSHWTNCNNWQVSSSGTGHCWVSVSDGSTRAVTAHYKSISEPLTFCEENPTHPDCGSTPPPPPTPPATLNVNSSNPSFGVPITGTGNLDSDNTSYSITKTTNLSGALIAEPTASNGNVFKNWSGCDSPSGTSCRVSVSTGSSKTVTAIYEQPNNPPVTNAGQDHWVLINREYGHSGAFATDQNNDLTSYQWSWESCRDYNNNSFTCPQLTGTSGSISGGDANISGPYYTPTEPGHYTTRLTVTDSRGNQASDTVTGTTPQGSDGIDNDGDGFTDYPDDPDLEGPYDNQESASPFDFNVFRFFER